MTKIRRETGKKCNVLSSMQSEDEESIMVFDGDEDEGEDSEEDEDSEFSSFEDLDSPSRNHGQGWLCPADYYLKKLLYIRKISRLLYDEEALLCLFARIQENIDSRASMAMKIMIWGLDRL